MKPSTTSASRPTLRVALGHPGCRIERMYSPEPSDRVLISRAIEHRKADHVQ